MACNRKQCCEAALRCLLFTTVCLSTLSWTAQWVAAHEQNDVRTWLELHSIPENELHRESRVPSTKQGRIWKPVSQGAGIADTIATVGRVFKYAIPKAAFRGDVSRYEIIEAGEKTLPSWMVYNGATQTLEGIPSETDMDQYYLTIKAYGKETNGSLSQASDVFSVTVIPDVMSKSSTTNAKLVEKSSNRGVQCSNDEPTITATIVLDADWGKLGVQRRIEPVSKMSQYSRLGLDQIRLLPVGSKSLLDSSVLLAGPGNIKRAEHPGVALSWQVGCGTDASRFPVVTILEDSSKDGSMAVKLGHNIIGWHVTNDRSSKLKQQQRVRRQAKLMGTPVPTPTPTDMPPKPTAISQTSVIPSTRVIPTESSPMLSSMMPTSSSVMPTQMASKTEAVRITLSASPTRTSASPSISASPVPPQPSVFTTVIEPTPVPTAEVPSPTFAPPMPSITAVEMTPSMIATILPSRTSVLVEETTIIVQPTETMMITPTPVPATTKPTAVEVTTPKPSPEAVTSTIPTTPENPTTEISAMPEVITTKPITTKPTPTSKPNTPPTIGKKLVRAGDAQELKFYKFVIPEDTFIDAEDGNTRQLTLRILDTDTGRELPPTSWIQFDKKTQTLQGLPFGVNVGRYSFIIEAFDSENLASPKVPFELVVKAKPSADDEEPPAISMGMSLDIDFDEFISNVSLQLDIMNRIASVFGDADPSAITFTNIQRGSVILAWTNNTIPTDGCNADLIDEIMSKLVDKDGNPTQKLKDAFKGMDISGVEAIPSGPCGTPTPPVATTKVVPPKEESSSEDMWISTVLPAVVIAVILLIAGIIIFILYRKSRKGKLSDEDQNTFINKGIPIIFADELEEPEKPPSSTTPLIMRDEKPPLPPPEYSPEPQRQPLLTNVNNSRSRNPVENKQNVPMVDLAGSPPYQPPPPLSPSPPPESRNSRPGNTPTYRAPPAYVPP